MREILFRGKRLDNGEWAYGFFNEFANRGTGEQEYFVQTVKRDGRIDYIRKVCPETVGQSTGLHAMGERLYEGDIVAYGDEHISHWWRQSRVTILRPALSLRGSHTT